MKIFKILFLLSCLLGNYNYSLEDYNETSPSYGRNVWEPEYLNHITMHYFATQGWAGWTATFGQLSNFQNELKNDGYQNIVIIGIGQTNFNASNNSFCANSDLPLVMDSFPNLPIRQQFLPYYDSHSIIILDYDGNYIGHTDVTNLGVNEKNYIRGVLEQFYQEPILGDINGDTLINIQDVVLVIDLVLNTQYDLSADMNDDLILNILDIVQIVNIILE